MCLFFAQFRNAHAATALPTFTLSGRPISHSMKYALRFQKQFIQVARECSKESFYDTEIFNLEFNLSHSPIPKILVIAQ